MKPIDYIYKNLSHLNITILEQLITDAGETVSEEIYDYLRETPWNTNMAILKAMGLNIEKSGEDGEEGGLTPIYTKTINLEKMYGEEEEEDESNYWFSGFALTSNIPTGKVNLTFKKDNEVVFEGDDNGQLAAGNDFMIPEQPFYITFLRGGGDNEFDITSEQVPSPIGYSYGESYSLTLSWK